ncbi:MAG TPA: GNAT family N-acetyltransferase [Lachnospiraceae bacterium]|nr:GNAT family N-acetyltransferase [Lachnospiraceae bacterium]HEX3078550.1 GNAT family N-acetyltransferase [Lachnospiraceae bacterium]
MYEYRIVEPNETEADYIDDMLMMHNMESKPFTQEEAFVRINRCMKEEDGTVIGGILAYSVMWNILYIDTLWIDKAFRGKGLGTKLLKEVEMEALNLGCHIAHLDTFDFQGKDFYIKNGYSIFGTLEDSPKGHSEYFLMKKL